MSAYGSFLRINRLVIGDTEAILRPRDEDGCGDLPSPPPWNQMCGGILGRPG